MQNFDIWRVGGRTVQSDHHTRDCALATAASSPLSHSGDLWELLIESESQCSTVVGTSRDDSNGLKMAVLCICGFCIPYSVVWPFVLLLLKQLYTFFFPGASKGEAKVDACCAKVTDANGNAVEVVESKESKDVTSSVPIAYNADMEWDEVVGGKTVILRFTAEWCKPCKAIDPLFQQLCADHHTSATFYNVDVDSFEEIAAQNGALSIPLFVAYRAGKRLGSLQSKEDEKVTAFVKENVPAQ